MAHNNLVELNMNALRGNFQVDEQQFKELIGHLNWKKFAERIQEQLQNNRNLTKEQKAIMEVNCVVALMRSHSFEAAEQMLAKCHKQSPALLGIKVFCLVRDKKFAEAFKLLEGRNDPHSLLLKVHILIQQRQPSQALDTLL